MERERRPLSIDSHIGLGNAAKNLRNRLVEAFCATTDVKVREWINPLLDSLDLFKCQMDAEVCGCIPRCEDSNNLAVGIYYGSHALTDWEVAELRRMEASLKTRGTTSPKPGGN